MTRESLYFFKPEIQTFFGSAYIRCEMTPASTGVG